MRPTRLIQRPLAGALSLYVTRCAQEHLEGFTIIAITLPLPPSASRFLLGLKGFTRMLLRESVRSRKAQLLKHVHTPVQVRKQA